MQSMHKIQCILKTTLFLAPKACVLGPFEPPPVKISKGEHHPTGNIYAGFRQFSFCMC